MGRRNPSIKSDLVAPSAETPENPALFHAFFGPTTMREQIFAALRVALPIMGRSQSMVNL